jgi:structural maintenance of chromosome 2
MLGMKERAKELEQRVKSMSGKVDRNAISKLEKDEKQEGSAKSMLAQVLKDKEKIEETIKELDRCKREALENTWEKVNGCVCIIRQVFSVRFILR